MQLAVRIWLAIWICMGMGPAIIAIWRIGYTTYQEPGARTQEKHRRQEVLAFGGWAS